MMYTSSCPWHLDVFTVVHTLSQLTGMCLYCFARMNEAWSKVSYRRWHVDPGHRHRCLRRVAEANEHVTMWNVWIQKESKSKVWGRVECQKRCKFSVQCRTVLWIPSCSLIYHSTSLAIVDSKIKIRNCRIFWLMLQVPRLSVKSRTYRSLKPVYRPLQRLQVLLEMPARWIYWTLQMSSRIDPILNPVSQSRRPSKKTEVSMGLEAVGNTRILLKKLQCPVWWLTRDLFREKKNRRKEAQVVKEFLATAIYRNHLYSGDINYV